MPSAVSREEFDWKNGKLVCIRIKRASPRGRWPRRDRSDLVVAIEDQGGKCKITYGPQADPIRVARAFTRFRNLDADPATPEIGIEVPDRLIEQVSQHCEAAVRKLVRQYRALATEEATTGLFVGDMNGTVYDHDGWSATIFVQGFSAETKEPIVGADFGVVVDVREGGRRVVKGFLAQAKRVDEMPRHPMGLPDLAEQVDDMRSRTDEAYILLYGLRGVEFRHPNRPTESLSVPRVIAETVRCRRGDRNTEVVAEALNRDMVLELAIAGPGAVWPFTPKRRV